MYYISQALRMLNSGGAVELAARLWYSARFAFLDEENLMPSDMKETIGSTAVESARWKTLYRIGGAATIFTLAGIVLDMVVGNTIGGGMDALPKTAVARFAQLRESALLGLYNLDLLNVINQILLVPAYVALAAAHRRTKGTLAWLALAVFLIGTTVFIACNVALPMLDLSAKYAAAPGEAERSLFAAAGEALLARGAHGGGGVFFSFLLPNIAGTLMGLAMLKGRVFGKAAAWTGIAGGILMIGYVILVTFVPGMLSAAMALAAPGGLLCMVWMVLFTVRLFKL